MLDYGYVFVTPEYIEGNGKSVHIFEVESMNVKNGKMNYVYKIRAVDGQEKRTEKELKKDEFKHHKTKKEVRKYVLYLQNKGDQVCSVCIGKFYGDVK